MRELGDSFPSSPGYTALRNHRIHSREEREVVRTSTFSPSLRKTALRNRCIRSREEREVVRTSTFSPSQGHLVLRNRRIRSREERSSKRTRRLASTALAQMLQLHRTALRRCVCTLGTRQIRPYHNSSPLRRSDPRLADLENVIEDDFAVVRERYEVPKHPIILAHGLLGFDELHLTGLPGIKYWRGISEALAAKGVEVITAEVPASGRIEVRAERLAEAIERKAGGKSVNIIA